MVPFYEHDCDDCQFLGTAGEDDLYAHAPRRHSKEVTLILRHSGDPADYCSFGFSPTRWRNHDALNTRIGQKYRPAIRAAIEKGLI
jgi:hypothetical protein